MSTRHKPEEIVAMLGQENARLRKSVSDLTLGKMILAAAAKGNY